VLFYVDFNINIADDAVGGEAGIAEPDFGA
jgi:hypothetical protein